MEHQRLPPNDESTQEHQHQRQRQQATEAFLAPPDRAHQLDLEDADEDMLPFAIASQPQHIPRSVTASPAGSSGRKPADVHGGATTTQMPAMSTAAALVLPSQQEQPQEPVVLPDLTLSDTTTSNTSSTSSSSLLRSDDSYLDTAASMMVTMTQLPTVSSASSLSFPFGQHPQSLQPQPLPRTTIPSQTVSSTVGSSSSHPQHPAALPTAAAAAATPRETDVPDATAVVSPVRLPSDFSVLLEQADDTQPLQQEKYHPLLRAANRSRLLPPQQPRPPRHTTPLCRDLPYRREEGAASIACSSSSLILDEQLPYNHNTHTVDTPNPTRFPTTTVPSSWWQSRRQSRPLLHTAHHPRPSPTAVVTSDTSFVLRVPLSRCVATTTEEDRVWTLLGNPDLLSHWCTALSQVIVLQRQGLQLDDTPGTRHGDKPCRTDHCARGASQGPTRPSSMVSPQHVPPPGEWIRATCPALVVPGDGGGGALWSVRDHLIRWVGWSDPWCDDCLIDMVVERGHGNHHERCVTLVYGPFVGKVMVHHTLRVVRRPSSWQQGPFAAHHPQQQPQQGNMSDSGGGTVCCLEDSVRLVHATADAVAPGAASVVWNAVTKCFGTPTTSDYMNQCLGSLARLRDLVEGGDVSPQSASAAARCVPGSSLGVSDWVPTGHTPSCEEGLHSPLLSPA